MDCFDHERLTVYRKAIEFIALVTALIEHLPKGHADLASQLQRAATSIVLNIAEGAGEWAPAEKARFYRIARRSATECAASLDVLRCRGLSDDDTRANGRLLLLEIVAMLTRMVINAGGQPRS